MAVLSYEKAIRQVGLKILSNAPMAPMYRIIRCHYPSGLDCNYHSSGDAYHAVIVLSGQMAFQERGGAPHLCKPGTVLSIPPDCDMRWFVDKDSDIVHLHHFGFQLDGHGALAYLFGSLESHLSSVSIATEHVDAFSGRLALAELSGLKDLELSLASLEILLAAAKAAQALPDGKPVEGYGRSPLARCIAYIEGNLDKEMSMAELAGVSFVSSSRLFQLFREKLDVSPLQYIARRKTELAERLLSDGTLNVGEVASRLGFNSISYFSRFFKRQTGRNPSERQRQFCH